MVSGIAGALRKTSLFAGLSAGQLESLLGGGFAADGDLERKFRPGDRIIEAGSRETGGMWVIVDGVVEVRKDRTPVQRFTTGDHFGEMALVSEQRGTRSADIIAMGDVTAVELQYDDLTALLADNPEVAVAMLAELARRLRATTERIEELKPSALSAKQTGDPLLEDDEFGSIIRSSMTPSISHFGPDQGGD